MVLFYAGLPNWELLSVVYNFKERKNILKMNKGVGMLLPKKRANTSGVGKINNYCEDIYIPPYDNTHSPHLYMVTIPIDSTH